MIILFSATSKVLIKIFIEEMAVTGINEEEKIKQIPL